MLQKIQISSHDPDTSPVSGEYHNQTGVFFIPDLPVHTC